jgi:methylenetetrahydrofolate reductase (NADPH)
MQSSMTHSFGASLFAETHVQNAIRNLSAAASIESSAKSTDEIDSYVGQLPLGTDIYIAWLPETKWRHLVDLAIHARKAGFNPVPHVAARRLKGVDDVKDYLSALQSEAGVSRVLLIAGETDHKAPSFKSSLELLKSGLLQKSGIRSVGIAGYPDGHPAIADEDLDQQMDEKVSYAQQNGIELFIVTQFGFDGNAVVSWLGKLRARGVTLPVRLGVAGPASVKTLLTYALRCGVGASIRAVSARAASLSRLIEKRGADNLIRSVAPHAAALGVAGLHVFPFGGFNKSAEWLRSTRENGL